MEIGGWLRGLGLEQYEAAFQANAVDADVLRDLTDQDLKKLGVLLGHRPKLLRAIAALDGELELASAPPDTRPPILSETILAAVAKRASQQRLDHFVSPSPQPYPMSSRLRSAEMIDDRFLPSLEGPRLLLAASDDREDDDIQTAETGEAYGADDYYDKLPSPRWRHHLIIVIAMMALVGLGGMGAFAYRAVFPDAVLPALPLTIKAANAPDENRPNNGDNRPSDLSQTSAASDVGSSEEFVSRFPADNQEPPETAPISPNPSASQPSASGSAVIPMVTAPSAPPPSIAPPVTSPPPKMAAPVPAPSSSTPKRIKTVISRSDGSGKNDSSAATAKSPAAKRSAAASAPPAENQLGPDAVATSPEAKPSAAVPVGKPLSLTPDAHGHSAAQPPPRSRMPATAAEASSGGGYAVAVASERSAADADAVFRSLQGKFPNQLGGREPIIRRTDLGPEGTYYQASIGPFASRKAAAGVCSSLKAAGESCLVEKN